jgi:tRNA G10  N-methylase Trm11
MSTIDPFCGTGGLQMDASRGVTAINRRDIEARNGRRRLKGDARTLRVHSFHRHSVRNISWSITESQGLRHFSANFAN